MILRSLQVEGWRCFASRVELGPFSDGLNIVFGPNGVGKSTLMLALARGLFDSHNVSGADMKALRPWGRSLSPRVTIEFEHDGSKYQLHKQFLSSATAKLSRWENGRFEPLAESRAADDRARALLGADAPGRGASDQRHWGLAQILWAPQGSLKIAQLADGTRATIRESLGAQMAGPGTESFERRITDAYNRFFTTRGKLKSGASAPPIVGLQKQLEEAIAQRSMLQQRLVDFDEASRRIEDLRLRTDSVRLQQSELEAKLTTARQQAQAFRELVSRHKLLEKDVEAADAEYRHLKERIDAIDEAERELKTVSRELDHYHEETPAKEKLVDHLQQELSDAQERVTSARARSREVDAARQLGRLAERYMRAREEHDDLDKRCTQLHQDHDELERLRDARGKIVAPDRASLRRIREIAHERDAARVQLDAALITVEIKHEAEARIEVLRADETGEFVAEPGTESSLRGAPDVAFRIPGFGSFRATGPTGSVEELRARFASATEEFDELTSGLGTTDVNELEKSCAEAEELDAHVAAVAGRIETRLDGETVDELQSRLSRTRSTLVEIEGQQEDWSSALPDPEQLLAVAEDLHQQFQMERGQAEEGAELARQALEKAQQAKTRHESEVQSLAAQSAAVTRRLDTFRGDGLDDVQRSEQRTQVAMRRDAAQGKLSEAKKHIDDFGDDPTKSLAVLEGQLDALRQDASDANRKLDTETGRLEQLTSEAPYSTLAVIEEKIGHLKDDITRQQLQTDAIRLLYECLAEQKREVVEAVLEPIRVRANLILQRVMGSRFGDVHFDDSLLADSISPRELEDTVPLSEISGGEQEQVYFAVRMALADVAFPDQRQLVVLDDVFTYTDTTRLARIAAILGEQAERFQIVLLTCHPERYRGLPDANFLDVEEAVQTQ